MVLEGCGLIVEPGDIRGLSEKISYLLDNEDVARALGHKARQKCLEQYSLDVQAPRLASILSRHERR